MIEGWPTKGTQISSSYTLNISCEPLWPTDTTHDPMFTFYQLKVETFGRFKHQSRAHASLPAVFSGWVDSIRQQKESKLKLGMALFPILCVRFILIQDQARCIKDTENYLRTKFTHNDDRIPDDFWNAPNFSRLKTKSAKTFNCRKAATAGLWSFTSVTVTKLLETNMSCYNNPYRIQTVFDG